jgi:hypothetical protein
MHHLSLSTVEMALKMVPWIPDSEVQLGGQYIYCPCTGLVPRLVQICGITRRTEKTILFHIRYVQPDGTLGESRSSVVGWFKKNIFAQRRRPKKLTRADRKPMRAQLEYKLQYHGQPQPGCV